MYFKDISDGSSLR